jgi:hypothetical protein
VRSLFLTVTCLLLAAGCADNGEVAHQPRPPAVGRDTAPLARELPKPLPDGVAVASPRAVESDGLHDFLQAYVEVGRPRLLVYVNRSLGGRLILGDPPTKPPVNPPAIDYARIESVLGGEMSCDGSSNVSYGVEAFARLEGPDIAALQAGQADALQVLVRQLDTDVLVQVQPGMDAGAGQLRLVAVAIDTRRAQVLGRGAVTVDLADAAADIRPAMHDLAGQLGRSLARTWRGISRP